ncbi:MAG: OmpA family protein [Deltaproteobacteria bacterium]|nr:OmpA family protein [Deltaproteobacteria bacterium]
MKNLVLPAIVLAIVFSVSSCAYQNKQQRGTAVGAGVGAAAGAALGQAIGGNHQSTLWGAAIGAVVGGLAGNQIGGYMDRQEEALRQALAESESASIRREHDVLVATFKSDIFFKFDSAALLPGAFQEIDRVATVFNRFPQTTIRIEGHTDTTGTENYNQQLSEKRAKSVSDALVRQYVDSRRITTIGLGETQPISSDHAMNRRVKIVIEPIQQG